MLEVPRSGGYFRFPLHTHMHQRHTFPPRGGKRQMSRTVPGRPEEEGRSLLSVGPGRTRTEAPAVMARGLAFEYPAGRTGLSSLDVEVHPGEVVVVLGPNGSGKSTLLRLLATDLRPTAGELRLLGRPAVPPTPDLRRRIGYAPDEPVHLDPLTGEENLRFFAGLAGSGKGGGLLDPDAREGEARRLLQLFALEPLSRVPVGQYSFGMRRKLLIAEALATSPDLLLLDEPTVGLDPEGVRALGGEIREMASRGAVVVMATNEVRETPQWATRIFFLHQGRVVVDGDPAELRARIPGGTRIRVALEDEVPELASVPGVTVRREGPGVLEGVSADGTRGLPALLQALVDAGAGVREIRVREPDLGDLFRELTGEELRPGEEPPVPAGTVPVADDSAESREMGAGER
jgi:ABC-2 type transport system ATP-binding protein